MHVILRLQRMDAVQPEQVWTAATPVSGLSTYIAHKQRLVKTGLVLVRGDQQPVLALVSSRPLWVIGPGIVEQFGSCPSENPLS